MDKKIIKASKFISLLLRHKPETIGLELDECGWASIDELVELSGKNGQRLDRSLIEQVVETSDKQRFSVSECGGFVRANQGHSIPVDLELEPIEPPEILFHGTATRFAESIFEQGLVKRGRQHVHLSPARDTAVNVGQRHGKPLILLVDARQMHADGHIFYYSTNGVWLTDHVPTRYLSNGDDL